MADGNPFDIDGVWLKSAFHTHTKRSDGELDPSAHVLHHEWAGFDVCTITDHWTLTNEPSTEHILVITGAELAADPFGDAPNDSEILAIGISEIPEDPGGDRTDGVRSTPITTRRSRTSPPPPHASPTRAVSRSWHTRTGVGSRSRPCWPREPTASSCSTPVRTGRTFAGTPPTCGTSAWIATNDCGPSAPTTVTTQGFDIGDAWTMVRAAERSEEAVLDALRHGLHYASSGPELRDIALDGDRARGAVFAGPRGVDGVALRDRAGPYWRATEPDGRGPSARARRSRTDRAGPVHPVAGTPVPPRRDRGRTRAAGHGPTRSDRRSRVRTRARGRRRLGDVGLVRRPSAGGVEGRRHAGHRGRSRDRSRRSAGDRGAVPRRWGPGRGAAARCAGSSGRRWIIDPIDGTKLFAEGIPLWTTLIALEVDGRLVLGIADAPAIGDRYVGVLGGGSVAWLASPAGVRASIGSTRRSSRIPASRNGSRAGHEGPLLEVAGRARRTRGLSDAWGHLLVAQGSVEALLEHEPCQAWDWSATQVIVEEAGGTHRAASTDRRRPRGAICSYRTVWCTRRS